MFWSPNRIKTTVAENDSDIKSLVDMFLSNKKNTYKIIGLDTERALKTDKQSKTVLLQLCDGTHCLIVPLHEDKTLPLSLYNFLNLTQFTFAGVDIKTTLKNLENEFGLTCKNAFEIGSSTWDLTNKTSRQKTEIYIIVSARNSTEAVFEDWNNRNLNNDQIALATSNAYYAFGIGNVLVGSFSF